MKKASKYLYTIVIAVIFIAPLLLIADDLPREIFREGNNAYRNGDYLKAIDKYEKILNNGYNNAEIYYNLGNAYFKLKKMPEAILNYEKAMKLNPSDEDIRFNLRVANLQTVDKIEPLPMMFYEKWWQALTDWFSSAVWSALMIIFIWLGFIGLAAYLFMFSPGIKKISFFVAVISFVIAIFSFIFANTSYVHETSEESAIIFSESVYVKSSPDKESTDLFILHEGTKVKILDQVGGWTKIRLANGNVGWLKRSSIETI